MSDEIKVGSRWRCTIAPEFDVEVKSVEDRGDHEYVVFRGADGGCGMGCNGDRFRREFLRLSPPPPADSTPAHYAFDIQPKDAIRAWGLNFARGSIIKYVARAGRKGAALDDLKKARDYLDDEIAAAERGGGE